MKAFTIVCKERVVKEITIEAKSKEEAIEKFNEGEFDENDVEYLEVSFLGINDVIDA